jgi:hypothetical protein
MTSKRALLIARWRLAVDDARLIGDLTQSGVNEFYGDLFNSNGLPSWLLSFDICTIDRTVRRF